MWMFQVYFFFFLITLLPGLFTRSLESQLFGRLDPNSDEVLGRRTDQRQAMITIQVRQDDYEETAANRIISATRLCKDSERALLFCQHHDQCDRMARRLGWRPYHSSVSSEDRLQAIKSWKEGAVVGLVSTSILSCCLDYPHVRYVFHLGFPRNVVDYCQAIGRAARGGGVGTSIVLA